MHFRITMACRQVPREVPTRKCSPSIPLNRILIRLHWKKSFSNRSVRNKAFFEVSKLVKKDVICIFCRKRVPQWLKQNYVKKDKHELWWNKKSMHILNSDWYYVVFSQCLKKAKKSLIYLQFTVIQNPLFCG